MNWIIDFILGGTRQAVRIRPDHLPGLRSPKPAPLRPPMPLAKPPRATSIQEYYERFQASTASQPENPKPKRMDK